jgi:uncharacterized repeat protein (TIGR01451 family)
MSVLRSIRLSLALCVLVGLFPGVAVAEAAPSAAWSIDSVAYPSDFSTADNAACNALPSLVACDSYTVTATNVGAKATGGGTVTLTDTLPAGLTPLRVSLFLEGENSLDVANPSHPSNREAIDIGSDCTVSLPHVSCVVPLSLAPLKEPVAPDQALKLYVSVSVDEPVTAGELVNTATVSGPNGLTAASVTRTNTLQQGPPPFGLGLFTAPFLGVDGLPESQAGGHPYAFDTRIAPTSVYREDPEGDFKATSVQDIRDVIVDLPLGMTGSGVSVPRCTLARLASKGKNGQQGGSGCSPGTIVGHLRTYPISNVSANGPIYNLIPEKGNAAELGFIDSTGGTHVLYVNLAPTPAGYVLRTTSREVPQLALTEILANVYGDPAARDPEGVPGPPTFTNPSDCTGEPLQTTILMDSWQRPGSYNTDSTPNLTDPHWVSSSYQSPPVTGCEALAGLFTPSLAAKPSTGNADSPTGLDVNLKVPQNTSPESLGTPPVKETVVTLPEGMTVDPSSANGLSACSEAQIGWQGKSPIPSGEYENFDASPPACPDASKIGTVELETPALPSEACKEAIVPLQECPNSSEREKTPIVGSIYVAQPYANPFGSLLAIYIVVNDPRTGVVVKIAARVEADPATGRLTTVVADTPQFPFSELRTHFYPGNAAALKTPATCGSYTVSSVLTPWSAPQSGPPATPQAGFEINQSAGGGACAAPGFSPSFMAGTSMNQAGGFSPFTVTFARNDGEQGLSGANVTMPPGVSAILTGVPLCPEPQANQGTCGEASLIGEATTAVGAGPAPYWVHGGKVYLTGPYGGGPFGLSIVVPTTAGPYTLTGNAGPGREVVRASIHVDPVTAQVTAASDPLPRIIQGIPLDIKTVNVTINRPGFTFNPTNCNPIAATGTLASTSGTSVPVSSRFQAAGCSGLAFKPKFTVSTSGKTSRQKGASLHTLLVYPKAPFGSQANIAKVKVDLPKQLPANNRALQKACRHQAFEENPASCPAESRVGTATATTPLLPVALTGPAYYVSYGGAKFPELVTVLQGYGVTVDLHGETFIDEHTKITSSTFKSVPDVPVNSFELNLPQGKYSALAAPTPLCGKKLTMPTLFVAQDGATIKQATKIAVSGCPKHKAKANRKSKHKRRK